MIILVVEKNNRVYAYNDKKDKIFDEEGNLHGYTEHTVAIKRANNIYVYNEVGDQIATYPYDFIDYSNTSGSII